MNLFADLPDASKGEVFETLLKDKDKDVVIERIVSFGQATPEGQWLQQKKAEWVTLLRGRAGLLLEGEGAERVLGPGDTVRIPAGTRHRVTWTAKDAPTVWLAVHYG